MEWDAEIVNEKPGRSSHGNPVKAAVWPTGGSSGLPRLPGERGTEVKVELEYESPAGTTGVVLAKLFGKNRPASRRRITAL